MYKARARVELREEVTEKDAKDVVELLQESLLDAFTNDTGEIDFGRKGGMSLTKQVWCQFICVLFVFIHTCMHVYSLYLCV